MTVPWNSLPETQALNYSYFSKVLRIKDQVPSPDITGRRNFLQGHTLPKLKSINSVQTLNISHKTFTASSRTVLDGVFKPWMSKLQLEAPLFLILEPQFLIIFEDQRSSFKSRLSTYFWVALWLDLIHSTCSL